VSQQRCWLIEQVPTVLLLENGLAGWVRHVEVFEPCQDGVYVSTGLAPIWECPFITRRGESIPTALMRCLSEAILRYEGDLG
jgi:hypothetical protein